MSSNNNSISRSNNSNSIDAATWCIDDDDDYEGATDLESFVIECQRVVLLNNNNNNHKNDDENYSSSSIVLHTKVCFCSTLKEFLASRTSITINKSNNNNNEEENGIVHIVIHAFIEPSWERAEHISSGGTPLLFIREQMNNHSNNHNHNHGSSNNTNNATTNDDRNDHNNNVDTNTTTTISDTLLARLQNSPTIALKLIRREAIEELHYDYMYRNELSSASNNNNNDDQSSHTSSSSSSGGNGPGSGDIDAARCINQLAVQWAIQIQEKTKMKTKTSTTTATVVVAAAKDEDDDQRRLTTTTTTCTNVVDVVCQNDRILDMKDATTKFVQSRVTYAAAAEIVGKKNDDNDDDDDEDKQKIMKLCIQSPSLVTPINSGGTNVRSRGSGCTFCKVIAPQFIVDAVAAEGYTLC